MKNVLIVAVTMIVTMCGFVYSQEIKETNNKCNSGTCVVLGYHSPSRCHL